ncbi:heavy metal translocating P-type ATPase, partial [Candidatus Parcubacteria bacterium]
MHPEIVRDAPGMCPECGMSLVKSAVRNAKSDGPPMEGNIRGGHDKHEGHSTRMFLRKFWVSLILTVPVVLYSDIAQKILGW